MGTMESFWTDDDVIFTYTREDALSDGTFVDLNALLQKDGRKPMPIPAAITAEVYTALVEWTDEDAKSHPFPQLEGARAEDIATMAELALLRAKKAGTAVSEPVYFVVCCVPRGRMEPEPDEIVLKMAGDFTANGDFAVTIMMRDQD
jgi:hypothetical protein